MVTSIRTEEWKRDQFAGENKTKKTFYIDYYKNEFTVVWQVIHQRMS